MKKLFSIIFIFYCLQIAFAQKASDFEGTIKYTISFEDSGLPPEATAMLKNAEMVLYIKGDKQRVDANMMMQNTSSIADGKNKSVVTLMDIMGKKYLIKMNENDIKKELDNGPQTDIKLLDGTKTIAGYTCKKAQITIKKNDQYEMTSTAYYTDDIPQSTVKPAYKGLNGCPLEYTINTNGMNMKMTATSVSKETVSDKIFEIPASGYTEVKAEDLQKQLMRQMQSEAH